MNFSEWKSAMESEDKDERIFAADKLPEVDDEELIPILIKGLNDSEDLVRVGVYESLGLMPYEQVRLALRNSVKRETDEFPLGYAIEALGKIGKIEDLIFILDTLKGTKSPRIQVGAVSGLVQGAQNIAINIFEKLLENQDYKIRCSAVNNMMEIIRNFGDHLFLMEKILLKNLKIEKERAVKSSIEEVLIHTRNILKYLDKVTNKKIS